MHRVYLNCELNIAIDVSENPHEGAFRSRDPTYLQDCQVWSPHHVPPWRDYEVYQEAGSSDSDTPPSRFEPGTTFLYSIFTGDDFSWSRLRLPLNQRAWVFQERLMSPRTLHFSSDRITWECHASILTEYLIDGVASAQPGGFDCLYQESYTIEARGYRRDIFSFYDLVLAYTERQLSFPAEDKLVAFSAVARRCAPWFGGDYCAGIYRNSMPWGLLWRTSFNPRKRPGKYRAPTWSWASLDVRVQMNPNIQVGETSDMVDIRDVLVQLVDPTNEFGPVTAASLTLTGPLVALQVLIGSDSATITSIETLPWSEVAFKIQSVLGKSFTLTLDEIGLKFEDGKASQPGLFLLAIGETTVPPESSGWISETHGLLVHRNGEIYTRAGYWEAGLGFVAEHANTGCEFRTETITIL